MLHLYYFVKISIFATPKSVIILVLGLQLREEQRRKDRPTKTNLQMHTQRGKDFHFRALAQAFKRLDQCGSNRRVSAMLEDCLPHLDLDGSAREK